MPVVGWTKLTLSELKDLCVACNLSDKGSKEKLSKRLHAYFEMRKGSSQVFLLGKQLVRLIVIMRIPRWIQALITGMILMLKGLFRAVNQSGPD